MDFVNIAITGGRDYQDEDHVWEVLDEAREMYGDFVLHVGDATGADEFARNWATFRNNDLKIYYAEWDKYGRAAGPIRNREIVKHADMLYAFPGGRGTKDCTNAAIEAGIGLKRV